MVEYFGIVCNFDEINESHQGKIVRVLANSSEEAAEKILQEIEAGNTGEFDTIEQIEINVTGCDCRQPVYDWFNGFELYK